MAEHRLIKFNHAGISTALKQLELSQKTQARIQPDTSDIGIMTQLVDLGELDAAIRFLALGLPAREAIWWSHLTAENTDNKPACPTVENTLKNTADWAKSPSEERRISAKKLTQDMTLSHASAWNAMGTYWSLSNVTSPGQQPGSLMHGQAIANSIISSAESVPTNMTGTKKHFIKQGLYLAMGSNGNIDNNANRPK